MDRFGERVKRARREQKISQRVLAEKIGINFTYLSKLENNEMPPPAEDKIYKLAEHLSIDPDELFGLAQRIPEELGRIAIEPHMPMILRAAKDLSEEDRQRMLEWIAQRKKQDKE